MVGFWDVSLLLQAGNYPKDHPIIMYNYPLMSHFKMGLPHDMLRKRAAAQASAVLSPFDHSRVDSLGQATPPCLSP